MEEPFQETVEDRAAELSRQLDRGFPALRFAPALEREFRRRYSAEHVRRIRFVLAAATALIIAFALLDSVMLPASLVLWSHAIRAGLILPAIVLALWATTRPRLHEQLRPFMAAAALATGVGTVVIIATGRTAGVTIPYDGLVLVTLFIYFLLGLLFHQALACSLGILAAYLAMELVLGGNAERIVYNVFFLASANVVGAMGCYVLEHQARHRFLSTGLLNHLAERDALTGLYNQRLFRTRFAAIWRQARRDGRPLALILVDVDHFKEYNDAHGHLAGDEALRELAGVLAGVAGRPLDLAARYGGEEFAVVLYDTSPESARRIGQSILRRVAGLGIPHERSPVAPHLTVSAGVAAAVPAQDDLPEDFVEIADGRLYEAKQGGRNRLRLADRIRPAGAEVV